MLFIRKLLGTVKKHTYCIPQKSRLPFRCRCYNSDVNSKAKLLQPNLRPTNMFNRSGKVIFANSISSEIVRVQSRS